MKATKIKYEKTFNLGNFSNEVIGVEIELEEGETAKQAIESAKDYVNKVQKIGELRDKLKRIEDNPEQFRLDSYQKAKEDVKENELGDELPF